MKQEIERQMENFAGSADDRIDPVAQALRRLYQRVRLCPCQFDERWKVTGCIQCQLDRESIEQAWDASQPATSPEK